MILLVSVWGNSVSAATMGVSLDVLSIPLGAYGARYHVHINDNFNLVVPVDVSSTSVSIIPTPVGDFMKAFGWGIMPTFKATIGAAIQANIQGWYVEPYVKAGYASIRYPSNRPELQPSKFLISVGGLIGHQTEFQNGLTLNLGIGFERRFFLPFEAATNSWTPNIVGAVGYVF